MPLPGETMTQLVSRIPYAPPASIAAAIQPQADGRATRWRDAQAAAEVFYNCCEPGVAEAAFARLGAEPATIGEEPLQLTPGRYGRVPRTYVECRADRILPIATQRAMVARQPPCDVLTLDSDHSPFYSA